MRTLKDSHVNKMKQQTVSLVMNKNSIVDYLIIGTILLIAIIAFIRIFYGVEITDEAYYIAEADIVSRGAIPFVNNWTQTPGFVILYAWLLSIYKYFVPNQEGIFIFMRISYFIFRMLILAVCYNLLKKHFNKRILAAAFIILIPFSTAIPMFSYNSISIYLKLLIGCICIYIIKDIRKDNLWIKCALAGSMAALLVYAHPSEVINFFVFGLSLVLFQKHIWKKAMISYLFGAGLITIIISGWMISKGGGIDNLIYGLDSTLNYNAYFKLGHNDLWKALLSLSSYFKVDMVRFFIIEFIGLAIAFSWNMIKRNGSLSYRKTLKICNYLWFFWSMTNNLLFTSSVEVQYRIGGIATFFLVILILLKKLNEIEKLLVCFVVLPTILYFIVNGFFSFCSIYTRLDVLVPCCIVLIIISYEDFKNVERYKISVLWCIWATLLLSFSIVKSDFEYFYREDSFSKLTVQIDEGIYKGIYTTQVRATDLTTLEKYIRSVTANQEGVLFMEVVPMAYLMSNGECCAPTTWDAMLYSYGFNDDSIMLRYYNLINKIPDKIIYIYTGRDSILSIDREDYKFNEFVFNNYELMDETDIGSLFEVRTYIKK